MQEASAMLEEADSSKEVPPRLQLREATPDGGGKCGGMHQSIYPTLGTRGKFYLFKYSNTPFIKMNWREEAFVKAKLCVGPRWSLMTSRGVVKANILDQNTCALMWRWKLRCCQVSQSCGARFPAFPRCSTVKKCGIAGWWQMAVRAQVRWRGDDGACFIGGDVANMQPIRGCRVAPGQRAVWPEFRSQGKIWKS